MIIEQLYTGCLAEAAYYIESEGKAVIIDPLRETAPYLRLLRERGATLLYVFETHFHADFVSGHIDLARATGALIVFGPLAETAYEAHHAKDGEEFTVGKVKIKVLHTPGHTPESSCFLLYDENGKEHALFTGDTLFVGDVGRPDLLDGKMSKEELAGMMYESLNTRIKTLPDDVLVYPAHGPGSACGKNIGKDTWSTIGTQKKTNYALADMSREEFILKVTGGLVPPPPYFYRDAQINKNGYTAVDEVIRRNTRPLSVEEVKTEIRSGACILDTRIPDVFEKGFIPGSVNIGLNGQFAVWVGTVLDMNCPLVIVAEEGKEEESVIRLARVGYENVKGVLKGGFDSWKAAGEKSDTVESISPEKFAGQINDGSSFVLDVRRDAEFMNSHVDGAEHCALDNLMNQLERIDVNKKYAVHCAGGYRSMIAISLLKTRGYHNLINVYGGYNKIRETSVKMVETNIS
ncbi:MAG: MBL fold metallo-hydrolase [Bacteroidia bacterium]|nr:MBL fold metallo-hydrolase [Bacteroidia bacterium]